jgi:hypothetical protein
MALSAILDAMSNASKSRFRVFLFKGFASFARRMHVSDEALWEVALSSPDADLGGGLYKYRIARPGEGARGGGRALIAMKVGSRAVLMLGWEKKDMENVTPKELKEYREAAKIYLGYTEQEMTRWVNDNVLIELTQPK